MYLAAADLTTSSGTNLAQYPTVQVNEGTGTATNCSDFVSSANLYNATGQGDTTKTLSAFSAASNSFANGVSSFAPTGSGQTKTYKITYWVQDNNAAAGMNSTAKLTWEAQNTGAAYVSTAHDDQQRRSSARLSEKGPAVLPPSGCPAALPSRAGSAAGRSFCSGGSHCSSRVPPRR